MKIVYQGKIYIPSLPEYTLSVLYRTLQEEDEDETPIPVQSYSERISIFTTEDLNKMLQIYDYWGFPKIYETMYIIPYISSPDFNLIDLLLLKSNLGSLGVYQDLIIYTLENLIKREEIFMRFYITFYDINRLSDVLDRILIVNPHLLLKLKESLNIVNPDNIKTRETQIIPLPTNYVEMIYITGYLEILRGPFLSSLISDENEILNITITNRYYQILGLDPLTENDYSEIDFYLQNLIVRIARFYDVKFKYRIKSEFNILNDEDYNQDSFQNVLEERMERDYEDEDDEELSGARNLLEDLNLESKDPKRLFGLPDTNSFNLFEWLILTIKEGGQYINEIDVSPYLTPFPVNIIDYFDFIFELQDVYLDYESFAYNSYILIAIAKIINHYHHILLPELNNRFNWDSLIAINYDNLDFEHLPSNHIIMYIKYLVLYLQEQPQEWLELFNQDDDQYEDSDEEIQD